MPVTPQFELRKVGSVVMTTRFEHYNTATLHRHLAGDHCTTGPRADDANIRVKCLTAARRGYGFDLFRFIWRDTHWSRIVEYVPIRVLASWRAIGNHVPIRYGVLRQSVSQQHCLLLKKAHTRARLGR